MTVRTEGGLPNPYEVRCSCSGCRNIILRETLKMIEVVASIPILADRGLQQKSELATLRKALKSKRKSKRRGR